MKKENNFNLIFDFDGTILDNIGIKDRIFFQYFDKFSNDSDKLKLFLTEFKGEKRTFKLKSLIKMGLVNKNANIESLNKYFQKEYMKVVKNKKLKISKELLIQKAYKNKLFIVSNAIKEELFELCAFFEIHDLFEQIVSCSLSKSEELKKLIKLGQLDLKKSIYIGDTNYDFISATDAKISFMDVNCFLTLYER